MAASASITVADSAGAGRQAIAGYEAIRRRRQRGRRIGNGSAVDPTTRSTARPERFDNHIATPSMSCRWLVLAQYLVRVVKDDRAGDEIV